MRTGDEGSGTDHVTFFVDDLPQRTKRRALTVKEILRQACVLGAEVEDARLVLVELRGGLRIRHRDHSERVEVRERQHFVTVQDF